MMENGAAEPRTMRKFCYGCGEWLPVEKFPLRSDRPGKRRSRCRACLARLSAIWRAVHPDYYREWKAKHPNYHREWRARKAREKHAGEAATEGGKSKVSP